MRDVLSALQANRSETVDPQFLARTRFRDSWARDLVEPNRPTVQRVCRVTACGFVERTSLAR